MAFGNYGKRTQASEINYEVKEIFGKLTDVPEKYNKELRLISWNGGEPKFDIRAWKEDENGEKMTKGITLTSEEVENLYKLLKDIAESDDDM